MHEASLNLIGKGIDTKEGLELARETLTTMRNLCLEFQQETGNLYNLEATPAESTSYRFARLDKKYHPEIITSGDKEPFLTNSTQYPVDKTNDAVEALLHQNEIQPLYTGGTIFHTFLGEAVSSGESCKKLVQKIAFNTRLPYFSITPTFSVCKDHGYIQGEHFDCPTCGGESEVYSRIVGYYRPVQNWNEGKREEFKFREEFVEAKSLKTPMPNQLSGALK
jgi:ribonucleoside-triphosphate reductase